MRVLLDTNVVLDLVLRRPDFFAEANELFFRLQNLEYEGYVSSITPVNTFYTTKKELSKADAFTAVEDLLAVVEICPADKSTMLSAFSLGLTDYEDAVQCASAVAAGLDAIVTRNTKDYANSPIPVYLPSQFLELLDARRSQKESAE